MNNALLSESLRPESPTPTAPFLRLRTLATLIVRRRRRAVALSREKMPHGRLSTPTLARYR